MRYSLLVTVISAAVLLQSCTPYHGTVRHNSAVSGDKPHSKSKSQTKAQDTKSNKSAQQQQLETEAIVFNIPEPDKTKATKKPPKKVNNFRRFRAVAKTEEPIEVPVVALNKVEDIVLPSPEQLNEGGHIDKLYAQHDPVPQAEQISPNAPPGLPVPPPEHTSSEIAPSVAPTVNDPSMALLLKAATEGDVHAYARLGEIYLNGENNVTADPQRAVEWYGKAADLGLPVAQLQMGDFYRDGIGVNKNNQEAIAWYTKAANQGEIRAMLRLGEIYKGWHDQLPNKQLAFKWYRQAASLGSEEAQTQLHLLLTANTPDAKMQFADSIQSLAKLAQAGNVKAMLELGNRYYKGADGAKKNVELAVQYFKSAAKHGSAEAAFKLGNIYFHGGGITADANQALDWYSKAADLGMPDAMFRVGEMYLLGQGIPRNLPKAREWLVRASDHNYAAAQALLGDMYLAGMGVPRYSPRAYYWYEVAAKHNDTYAQFMLSILYAKGIGVDLDLATSVDWYKKADLQEDNLVALTKVAKNYEKGFPFQKNGPEALRWYSLAATEGYAPAQTALGDLLSIGDIIDQDLDAAVMWYQLAATNGHPYGQYSLGLALLEGYDPDSTDAEAVSWLKKAAYQGFKPAQYVLGRLYFEGINVKRNDVRAYGWWSLSLKDIDDMTPTVLSDLIDKMEPGYRERAVLLADRYKERYGALGIKEDQNFARERQ